MSANATIGAELDRLATMYGTGFVDSFVSRNEEAIRVLMDATPIASPRQGSARVEAEVVIRQRFMPVLTKAYGGEFAAGFVSRNFEALIEIVIAELDLRDKENDDAPAPITVRASRSAGVVICGATKEHWSVIKEVAYKGVKPRYSNNMERQSKYREPPERCAVYIRSSRAREQTLRDVRAYASKLAAALRRDGTSVRVDMVHDDPRDGFRFYSSFPERRLADPVRFPALLSDTAVALFETLTDGLTVNALVEVPRLGKLDGVEIRRVEDLGNARRFYLRGVEEESESPRPEFAELLRASDGTWTAASYSRSQSPEPSRSSLRWNGREFVTNTKTSVHSDVRDVERWAERLARLPREHVARSIRTESHEERSVFEELIDNQQPPAPPLPPYELAPGEPVRTAVREALSDEQGIMGGPVGQFRSTVETKELEVAVRAAGTIIEDLGYGRTSFLTTVTLAVIDRRLHVFSTASHISGDGTSRLDCLVTGSTGETDASIVVQFADLRSALKSLKGELRLHVDPHNLLQIEHVGGRSVVPTERDRISNQFSDAKFGATTTVKQGVVHDVFKSVEAAARSGRDSEQPNILVMPCGERQAQLVSSDAHSQWIATTNLELTHRNVVRRADVKALLWLCEDREPEVRWSSNDSAFRWTGTRHGLRWTLTAAGVNRDGTFRRDEWWAGIMPKLEDAEQVCRVPRGPLADALSEVNRPFPIEWSVSESELVIRYRERPVNGDIVTKTVPVTSCSVRGRVTHTVRFVGQSIAQALQSKIAARADEVEIAIAGDLQPIVLRFYNPVPSVSKLAVAVGTSRGYLGEDLSKRSPGLGDPRIELAATDELKARMDTWLANGATLLSNVLQERVSQT